MEWLIGITAIVGTWSFLSVLGSERERRTRDLDLQIAQLTAQSARAATDAAAANSPPHVNYDKSVR